MSPPEPLNRLPNLFILFFSSLRRSDARAVWILDQRTDGGLHGFLCCINQRDRQILIARIRNEHRHLILLTHDANPIEDLRDNVVLKFAESHFAIPVGAPRTIRSTRQTALQTMGKYGSPQ